MNHEPNPVLRRVTRLGPLLAMAAGVVLWAPADASASPPLRTGPVTPSLRAVLLPASLHPSARPESDIGRMDPGIQLTGLSLLLQMSAEQKVLQKRALAAVQDPASPSYHHWLTPEEYATQFGASAADIARASRWLTSQGLSVDGPSRTGSRLTFRGTVAQIERAFQTEMHRYQVSGAAHFAMSRAPSVPPDLANLVLGLHGLHDFRAKAPPHAVRPLYGLPVTEADGAAGGFPAMAPADFATIYDVGSLYAAHITGTGQSIAVAEESDFNDADIAAFRTTFKLSGNPPQRLLVPNTGAAAVNGALVEAELDLEWAGAVAPDATIVSVFTGDAPNSDVFDAMLYAIEQRVAPVLSTSYGQCEAWFTGSDRGFLEAFGDAATLEGMTVVGASGDSGAAACDDQTATAASHGQSVDFPASIPSVVAVGGSQFQINRTNQSTYLGPGLAALSYIPESGWNETLEDIDAGFGGLGAGGGGASRLFAKPYWQVAQTPGDGSRDLPDVALSASADTLPYVVSMSWTVADGDAQAPQPEALTAFGGTSASAPAFAGVLALLNQALASTGSGPSGLGNANPMLYALAASPGSASVFHDLTTGTNVVPCEPGSPDCPASPPYQYGYAASAGYDQVTGLGSIDVANLVAAWTTLAPTSTTLQITAAGTTEGSPLQLEATVASSSKTHPMTGTVTFYFETLADGGVGATGILGSAPIAASPSGAPGGTASLAAMAPGGFSGSGARVSAFYSGDPSYVASWSIPSAVQGSSNLALCPPAVTLAAGQTGFAFKTLGGVAPITWYIRSDRTCAFQGDPLVCSTIDSSGVFTAGPQAGSATVVAVDQFDSYVTAQVTVTPATDGAAPLPVVPCSFSGGGSDGGAADAAVQDASPGMDADSGHGDEEAGKGCGCKTAGSQSGGVPWGSIAGTLFAFAGVVRRVRRRARR
jgi:hypothetical protein